MPFKWTTKNRLFVRGTSTPHKLDPPIPVTPDAGWADYAAVAHEYTSQRRSFEIKDGLDSARFASIADCNQEPAGSDPDVEWVRRCLFTGWTVKRGSLRTDLDLPYDRAASGLLAYWLGRFGFGWLVEQNLERIGVQVWQSNASDVTVVAAPQPYKETPFVTTTLWSATLRRYFFALPADRWERERDSFLNAVGAARKTTPDLESLSDEWVAFVLARDLGRADRILATAPNIFALHTDWLVPSLTSLAPLAAHETPRIAIPYQAAYDLVERFGADVRPVIEAEWAYQNTPYNRRYRAVVLKMFEGALRAF